VLTAPFGLTSTVNVLSNDDFLPVASNEITRIGGNASGTVVCPNNRSNELHAISDRARRSNVTVVYQVCNTLVTPKYVQVRQ
jgi:hypothetical protein